MASTFHELHSYVSEDFEAEEILDHRAHRRMTWLFDERTPRDALEGFSRSTLCRIGHTWMLFDSQATCYEQSTCGTDKVGPVTI